MAQQRSIEEQNRVNDEFAVRLQEFNRREEEIRKMQEQMQEDGRTSLAELRARMQNSQ